MNCLDFRRLHQAAPHHLPVAAQSHLDACDACRAFTARTHQLDEALRASLESVPVPEGLNDRILLHAQAVAPAWRHWPIAAGLMITLSAALVLSLPRGDTSLARAALAHVEEEPDTLRAHQTVSAHALAESLATIGARLTGDIGQVTYLGTCTLPGGEGKHLVVNSPHGRYSLILMPRQAKSRKTAEAGMHMAIAKPAARGSYAIVASTTPDIIRIERLLERNVTWAETK